MQARKSRPGTFYIPVDVAMMFCFNPQVNLYYTPRLLLYVLPVITISAVLNIPKFFETEIVRRPVEAEAR